MMNSTAPSIVLSLDFDGTLVDAQGRIHPQDRDILGSEQRLVFMPATGRSLPSVRRTFRENGLFRAGAIPLPLVLQNGAALYGPAEILSRYRRFPPDVQEALVAAAYAQPAVTAYFYTAEELYCLWPSPYAAHMELRFSLDPVALATAPPGTEFSKLMCICGVPAALHALETTIADLPVTVAYSLPTVMEVNLKGTDKGTGARALLEALGWQQARLIVAGDGENDLGLFAQAEAAFAPASSPDHIKARATHVIDIREAGLLKPILDVLL